MSFVQSAAPFSGLTNTDLRPRRRRRRPVPLLDTSWLIHAARRRKGDDDMRKELSAMIGTLRDSVAEISGSAVENRDELLTKSFGEFEEATLGLVGEILPPDEEPLAKGLNHIATFANLIRDCGNRINAMKTGSPSWMISGGEGSEKEVVGPGIAEQMDHFLNVGILTLRSMVNETAALPDDEEDLERAEQMGDLAKIEMLDGTELLVKTALPADYHDLLTDPVDLLAEFALAGRVFTNQAMGLAKSMAAEDALPDEIVTEFPELFEPMGKAAPDAAAAGGEIDPGTDPDPGGDLTDDAPQNPIEMMVRLASIIVVVGGSILQSGDAVDPNADPDADPDEDPDAAPAAAGPAPTAPAPKKKPAFMKSEPVFDAPLEKIFSGEIAVDPSVADALEELVVLRGLKKRFDTSEQELSKTTQQLQLLQSTVDRLQAMPAAPKGVVFQPGPRAVTKQEDSGMPGGGDVMEAEVSRIGEMAKNNPDGAAKELLKKVHMGGGTPLVPPGGPGA